VNACIVIPFYNHERAIGATVAALRPHGVPCWIVDDGSHVDAAAVLDQVAAAEKSWVRVLHCQPNRGKGHAVMAGFRAALAAGFSHGLQVDADGQHDAADVPKMLALARQHPEAIIAGVPLYDASVPKARLYGRYITHFWVWVHTLSLTIRDSMCGFRVYPLASTLRVCDRQHIGERMDFDTEILVRLYWEGVEVVNMPTRVTYPLDGVSHFRMGRDNLRISWMHTRLFFGMLWRLPRLLARKWTARNPALSS
jgi:glycosyltransferase involved in cell wall biosynthesis